MICLYKKTLPTTITVEGEAFIVHTDFRFWLAFLQKVKKQNLMLLDVRQMFPCNAPKDFGKTLEALFNFANQKNELPRDTGHGTNAILLDYDIDADLIFSAFYEAYHIDLLDENTKIHFHKFLALFNGLHNTKLNEIMRIRAYDENDKTPYAQAKRQQKEAWEIREEIRLSDYEKQLKEKFENALV